MSRARARHAETVTRQMDMFGACEPLVPGLGYRGELITPAQEQALVEAMRELPFRAFEFHGFTGHRRVVSFGWRYAFDGSGLHRADPMPDFLLEARALAAAFAGLAAEALEHALLTEYQPGAAIGWHRDRPAFGEVVGLSLLSPARLRFRRKVGAKWERAELEAEPRSAYHLSGEVRSDWEHSIPAVHALRYSITFRTLRKSVTPANAGVSGDGSAPAE